MKFYVYCSHPKAGTTINGVAFERDGERMRSGELDESVAGQFRDCADFEVKEAEDVAAAAKAAEEAARVQADRDARARAKEDARAAKDRLAAEQRKAEEDARLAAEEAAAKAAEEAKRKQEADTHGDTAAPKQETLV